MTALLISWLIIGVILSFGLLADEKNRSLGSWTEVFYPMTSTKADAWMKLFLIALAGPIFYFLYELFE